ncbi:hypothetical protein QCA50_001911 [Cerrena zonata]|uniref:NADPH-dependent FMN reductase-like domain-containing protein n=1 Tax=Cerrena zonata TaxID=2478898 RepID=A0AAW0GMA6_9APHY
MTVVTRKVGLILASARRGGNASGLATWLKPLIQTRLNKADPAKPFEVVTVDPHSAPFPAGALTDGSKFPAQVTDSKDYASPAVREWSQFISSCSAFVILCPEYNGGYPGEIKNALDQLFHEWAKKPVTVVTYGGGGGSRAAKQLTDILKNLQMQPTPTQPQIAIPGDLISGAERVTTASTFLIKYEPVVEKAVEELEQLTAAAASA